MGHFFFLAYCLANYLSNYSASYLKDCPQNYFRFDNTVFFLPPSLQSQCSLVRTVEHEDLSLRQCLHQKDTKMDGATLQHQIVN